MLKKQTSLKFERKKSELKLSEAEMAQLASQLASKVASKTAGETIRDAAIKAATETAYLAGNNTDKFIEIADKIVNKTETVVEAGTALVGGTESSKAIANIGFKTMKDIARGDKVCTGLCFVSATCETLALGCSVAKVIPFRGKVYIGCKIISTGCMTYRNACAGEGC